MLKSLVCPDLESNPSLQLPRRTLLLTTRPSENWTTADVMTFKELVLFLRSENMVNLFYRGMQFSRVPLFRAIFSFHRAWVLDFCLRMKYREIQIFLKLNGV